MPSRIDPSSQIPRHNDVDSSEPPVSSSKGVSGDGRQVKVVSSGSSHVGSDESRSAGNVSDRLLARKGASVEPGRSLLHGRAKVSRHTERAIKLLAQAPDSRSVDKVLYSKVKTSEQLCELCRNLPDASLMPIKANMMARLERLEADFHLGNILKECVGSDGGLDQELLAKAVCQNEEFMHEAQKSDYFTEKSNYIRGRVTDPCREVLDLLARFEGCDRGELVLSPLDIMNSGAGPAVTKAGKQGREALERARVAAVEQVDEYLEMVSPGKPEKLRRMTSISNRIGVALEQQLIGLLKPEAGELIKDYAGSLKADSVVNDLMLKVKTVDVLTDHIVVLQNKMLAAGESAEERMGAVFGDNLGSCAQTAGQVILGCTPDEIPADDQRWIERDILRVTAQRLMNECHDRVGSFSSEGVDQLEQVAAFMSMLNDIVDELHPDNLVTEL